MTSTMDREITPEQARKNAIEARFEAGTFDGLFEVIDRTGDTKIMWDKNNEDEVAMAKAAFETAKGKNMGIFVAEGKRGKAGARVTEFDPDIERMIAVPQLVGG